MKAALEGNFSVKLEFSDDSFELTDAQISSGGHFSCASKKNPSDFNFKMVLLSPENELLVFSCSVDKVQEGLITGRISELSH